mgnify:FL=1
MKMVASFATYILSVIAVLALVTVIVLDSQPPANLDLTTDTVEPHSSAPTNEMTQ